MAGYSAVLPMAPHLPAQQPPGSPVDGFLARLSADPEVRERLIHSRREAARAAETRPPPESLSPELLAALRAVGREDLYAHQREAIDHALAGRNVCIATETSSGKSLAFQLPVLAATLADPQARALFVFPTNPLANDQEASLAALLEALPAHRRPRGPVRLQGAMGAAKDRLAADEPQIVLTNPEMVHLHLLPQHRRWARFWAGLEYLIVDEIHLYRGAFGGHLANLLRRVRRCAWRYGAKPRVLAASATVRDPRGLAEELCATPFELVDRSTAPRGARTTVLWRPPPGRGGEPKSHVDESVDVFRRALEANLQSILFARSRQLVETMVSRLEERTGRSRVALGVRAYRAGYLREEREVIEKGLRNGNVRGVVTTNALEVGVDIGSLDVCVMAGYPGSVMALRQQSGRVGRRDRASAIFLVASANPLDAWLLEHPDELFAASLERAVVGRLNAHVLRAHLLCAASEFPLWEAEIERFGGESARRIVSELVRRGEARWVEEDGRRVLTVAGRPQGGVSLRSATQERWQLVDPDGEGVGEIDGASVAREAYPGAIYLHQGRAFRVDRHESGRVHLSRASATLSTRVQAERTVKVLEASRRRALKGGAAEALLAPVAVIDRHSSFLESDGPGRAGRARAITPPLENSLVSEGLILRLSPAAAELVRGDDPEALEAALHAAEHLLVAFGSSFALCDRDDLEGHALSGDEGAGIVLFDRHPGGMGFAAAAYEAIDEIVSRAAAAVLGCPCRDGCPACIHSGRCLRGNEAVSKAGARLLLRLVLGEQVAAGSSPAGVKVRRAGSKPVVPAEAYEPVSRQPKSNSDKPWKPSFEVGDTVEHVVYGRGTVLEVRPSGRVVVDFGEGRSRRITPGWLKKA
jgi:DEAD/DEAH box helicase domain-containing protein